MGNEDEARRKLLKPKVTPEEALSILTDFGGDGCEVITQLDSYDDINFLLLWGLGNRFYLHILKTHL